MKKEVFDSNPILKLLFDFSLMVIDYCEKLENEKKYVIARQLLKSGTSIGANAMEAQNGKSKADFIHKIKNAAKQTGKLQYWLRLCEYSNKYPGCKELIAKLKEINKVIGKILSTAKKRLPFSYLLIYFIF